MWTKEQAQEYQRRWYRENSETHKRNCAVHRDRSKKRNKDFVIDYLRSHPCIDCGEDDIVVLQFDHVRGLKSNAISSMVHRGVSLRKLTEEIEKCDVRCANCHARRTATNGSFYRTIDSSV